jgi:hypothetical protein
MGGNRRRHDVIQEIQWVRAYVLVLKTFAVESSPACYRRVVYWSSASFCFQLWCRLLTLKKLRSRGASRATHRSVLSSTSPGAKPDQNDSWSVFVLD